MSETRARAVIGAYRLAGVIAYPLVLPYTAWRASRGKEERGRRGERSGVASAPRPDGPLVWVHAASVGESAAVAPVVERIFRQGLPVVMTTGTVTAAALVKARLAGAAIHQYAPLDLKPCIARFLDHWRPDVAIVAESEIWPATMAELGRRNIPQILVNARLSDRSFRRWKAVPAIAEAVMRHLTHVVAQSPLDAERYHALGARSVTMAGNLKADAAPLGVDDAEFLRVARACGDRPVWAAVSTHVGEERLAGEVHKRLKVRHPDLLTLIVPRHAERGAEIARGLEDLGLTVARRSLGQQPDGGSDVMLGDTMNEMGLYLRLTEIVLMGKSILAEGGQNPLEAAMLGNAILSGRHVQNFRGIYAKLIETGGARLVSDGGHLFDHLDFLLADPLARNAMAAAARGAVRDMRGALVRTMDALHPFLHPLQLSVSLDRRSALAAPRR